MRSLLRILSPLSPGNLLGRRALAAVLAILLAAGVSLALPAIQAAAQGAQVEVRAVKPIQVIEDAPLIAGKPTAVKVVVNSTGAAQANIEVALGPSRKTVGVGLNPGLNTFYVPVDPPTAAGSLEVVATVTAGASNARFSQLADVIAPDLNRLNIVLLPVDWSDKDRSSNNFPVSYNTFAGAGADFLKATYPIQDSGVKVEGNVPNFMLTAKQRAIADKQGNLNWENLTAMYTAIALAGRRAMPNADLVVGVLPPKWFARNLNEPKTVGLEFHAVKRVVAAQVNSDYATLSHEVGHVFRQDDDYNFNINPPKIGDPITVPGYRVGAGKPINPGSAPVYYSFMAASDPGSEYWVDMQTYTEIMNLMQSGRIP